MRINSLLLNACVRGYRGYWEWRLSPCVIRYLALIGKIELISGH